MFSRNRTLLILIAAAITIKIFSLDSAAVEKYYSTGLYPYIASLQRIIFGWIPFSIGDIFYTLAGLWLIRQLILLIRKIKNKTADSIYLKKIIKRFARISLTVYIAFNFLWGLNYNRYGIDYQMQLNKLDYSDSDLVNVTRQLAYRLNSLQPVATGERKKLYHKKSLFSGAVHAYRMLSLNNPILKYSFASIKPSIYSYLGNYLGFTGYYNPFSGEAQVNTTVPVFIRPFTTCHEIGHQLGYAKESEANFSGFLSATSSDDPAFLYSVYFDMYAYAAKYLYFSDSTALYRINKTLSAGVKEDIKELREFSRKYSTPVETAIDKLYSEYLKANEQPSGKMSYNEVVALLIAYHKKYGRI
jgi:uncharacterized protein DUF3810